MPGCLEGDQRGFELGLFDQQVVGVEGRQREYAHAGFGKRLGERGQDSDKSEVERSLDLETTPTWFDRTR